MVAKTEMNGKLKRILRFIYYLPSTVLNKVNYKFRHVMVGHGHETKGFLFIRVDTGGSIRIGDNVRINSKASANPIGAGERTYFQVLKGACLVIGDNTRMSNCAITAATKVTIGNYVRIGAGVKIYDTDFHSLNPYDRTAVPEKGEAKKKPVVISDYAFIGAGSYILKGVTIGRGAVVGAASVVTKDIPEYEIWGGNPARKIGVVDTNTL